MSPDQIVFLKTFDYLHHPSMDSLPDGWIGPLVDLLQAMRQLSLVEPVIRPMVEVWVSLRIEHGPSGALAFAAPLLPIKHWGPERALACVEALATFTFSVQETCSVCGHPGHLRFGNGRREGIFCDDHSEEYRHAD
ncbi:hypothetical protein U8C31_18210 [Sinorhizobium medicae]|uniref:hypothetical protein n=1 Tax=Sinorhizobium medicae TaxID=110321 RepID=UPI002AF6A53E|nr:hypothetical protein [Sinorhizobium medicae]WQO72171.1 hypothetical protein U8C31_18210 [Sinorhizobium medicae]